METDLGHLWLIIKADYHPSFILATVGYTSTQRETYLPSVVRRGIKYCRQRQNRSMNARVDIVTVESRYLSSFTYGENILANLNDPKWTSTTNVWV